MKKATIILLVLILIATIAYFFQKFFGAIQLIDKIDKLPRNGNYGQRSLDKIVQIAIHHSASMRHKAEDFAQWHVEKGWPGIGYHFVIEKNGDIIQVNSLNSISYHVSGQNTRSIGICLSGDFMQEEPTRLQLLSMRKLVAHLRRELPQSLEVVGHRDFGQTACPGDNLYKHISPLKLRA